MSSSVCFDLRHVDPRVVLQPHAVLVGAVDLADAVFAERAELGVQVAAVLQGVGEVEVAADGGRADFVEQRRLRRRRRGPFRGR